MTRFTSLPISITASVFACLAAAPTASAAEFAVEPSSAAASDQNPGTAGKPLKTLARALDLAKGGDSILLGAGNYPAVAIGRTYEKPLTISAAKGARPVMAGGLAVNKGGGLRVSGLTFTWPSGARPTKPMTPFIEIAGARNVEIAECEIYDDPNVDQWVGWACSVSNSEQVTVRDCKAHHFYFGFSAYRSKDVTFRNLVIGPWSHEDGARVTECEGPVLIEGCHITNTGKAGSKSGHVDGIQVVNWADNLTIRNCHMHGLGQGIGAFGDNKGRRRKNWRIEGNLIHDIYAPHTCSVYETDGVTVVNNTFPQGRLFLINCTGGVVKNNIFGLGGTAKDANAEADYNLWIANGTKLGEHDLANVDPKFVNAPLLTLKADSARLKEMTRSKILFRESTGGKLTVGDTVEVMNTDGAGRDAKARKVTAVGDNWIEIDTPMANDPDWAGVFVYQWPAGQKDLKPDYHLMPDSPAIDSADSSAKRGRDMDGHEPTDSPGVENTGAGSVKYLDRGALEFVPAKLPVSPSSRQNASTAPTP